MHLKPLMIAVLARGIAAGAELLFALTVVRLLGPNEAGVFFLVFAAFAIAVTIARSGPDIAIVRRVAVLNGQGRLQEIKAISLTCIAHVSLLGIGAGVILYASVPALAGPHLNGEAVKEVSLLLGLAVAPAAMGYLFAEALKGHGSVFLAQALYGGPLYALGLVLILVEGQLLGPLTAEAAAIALLLGGIFTLGLSAYAWRWAARDVWRAPSVALNFSAIRESASLAVIRPLSMLMVWLPTLALGATSSSEEVAVYSVALRIALAVALVLFALEGYAAPRFAALYERHDVSRLRRFNYGVTAAGVMVALPVTAALYTYADAVFELFFPGNVPLYAVDVMRVLLAAQVVNVLTGPVASLLMMGHRERLVQIAQIGTLLLAVPVLVWRIPERGALGAAEGYLVVVVVMNLGLWLCAQRTVLSPANKIA